MAAHDGAGVCCVVCNIRRAELDRATAHAPPRPRGRARMNWRIRLTWWDKLLLAIVAVAAVIAFFRFPTGIGTIANINNAYPWGWGVCFGDRSLITSSGGSFSSS